MYIYIYIYIYEVYIFSVFQTDFSVTEVNRSTNTVLGYPAEHRSTKSCILPAFGLILWPVITQIQYCTNYYSLLYYSFFGWLCEEL